MEILPGANAQPRPAQVVLSETIACRTPQAMDCRELTIELTDGAESGSRSTLNVGDAGPTPALEEGARVRVVKNEVPPGAGAIDPYALVEVDRRSPMLWPRRIRRPTEAITSRGLDRRFGWPRDDR